MGSAGEITGSWRRPRFRFQGVLSGVLLALGLLILLTGTLVVWMESTVLDTDEFVDTVGPLIEDQEVTDAIARSLNQQVFADLSTGDVLSERLPDLPAFVPELLDSALQDVTLRLTQDLLQTELVRDIWFTAVRAAHNTAAAIISGDTPIQDDNGQVVLDLSPVVERLADRVSDLGLDLGLVSAAQERGVGQIVILEDGQLGVIQDSVELLDTLSWFLPVAAIVLLGAAIYLSPDRRLAALYSAVGLFVLMIVLALGLRISRNLLLDGVKEENRQAAENVWDHLIRRLSGMIIGLLLLSIVVFVALWLTGRSPSSVKARASVGNGLERLRGGRLGEVTPEGLDERIAPRRRAIQIGAVLVTVAILWAQPKLSGTAVVVAAIGLGLFLLAVEFVVRPPQVAGTDAAGTDVGDDAEGSDDGVEDSELTENV